MQEETISLKLTDQELALLSEVIRKTDIDKDYEGAYLNLRLKIFRLVDNPDAKENNKCPSPQAE